MKIILITGTKGKTTLAFMLNAVFLSLGKETLCISSEGIIENGKIKKDNEHFLKKYGTSANVVAIKEISLEKAAHFDYVIIEASYSAGKNIGNSFAKKNVDLAIFTNVYHDHIGGKVIKSQKDLFNRKLGLLLENLKKNGTATIYTGDKKDNLSYKALPLLKKARPDLSLMSYDEKTSRYTKNDGIIRLHLKNNNVFHNSKKILDIDALELPFGDFPVLQNNLAALSAALISLGINPQILIDKSVDLSVPGRLNIFSHNNHVVILDYAHEIKSLSFIASFIRKKFTDRKIHAIVRFSYYRNEKTIEGLTAKISRLFDSFTIYDKALSRPALKETFTFNKKAGSVAKLMNTVLKRKKAKTRIINDEIEAIKKSIDELKKNEILFIMGDQMKKDIATIKNELRKK